ncbi:MAG: LCP family protein [Lachnospiraceae bacterium]|nr:LCP family protein [Candidatus Minthocola equi]
MEQQDEKYLDDINHDEEDTFETKRDLVIKKIKKRRIIFTALLACEAMLLVLAILGTIAFFYIKSLTYDNMNTGTVVFDDDDVKVNEDLPEDVKIATEKYTTIMLYGVDARNNRDLVKDANADTDIIVVIDNDTYEVKMVSVLRDTFMSMTNGKYRKLTDIYSGWGVKESLESVNRNFDLRITKYVAVNWKSLADAINMLGGLDIDLTTAEINNMNSLLPSVRDATGLDSYPITGTTGTYHLDGVMSVCYARVRHVGTDHDIGRASRQRIVITKMLESAKEHSIGELTDICEEVFPGIATNLTFSEILGMMMNVLKYNIGDQTVFPFKYVDQEDKVTAYVYCNTLVDNVTQLHTFLYGSENYSPSGTVQLISEYIKTYRKEHP